MANSQNNIWHVTGTLNNKSCDLSCVASDIYDAIRQAEEYGLKDISGAYRSSSQ